MSITYSSSYGVSRTLDIYTDVLDITKSEAYSYTKKHAHKFHTLTHAAREDNFFYNLKYLTNKGILDRKRMNSYFKRFSFYFKGKKEVWEYLKIQGSNHHLPSSPSVGRDPKMKEN